jgi:16S rRNA (guanine966-N2)-methyltransferase
MRNKIRIIGGQWRSRQLPFQDSPGLRPTPARVRETLFNWLQHDIMGSRCLDLYAGSGALGVEAASRGAKHVIQVEQNPKICRQLQANAQLLKASQLRIIQQDVFRYLATGEQHAFDIVFLDPPFKQNLAIQTCQWLDNKGWLKEDAHIYLEVEKGLPLTDLPTNWQVLRQKSAGEVDYYLFAHRC